MKQLNAAWTIVLALCITGAMVVHAKDKESDDEKTGDTTFTAYDGSQSWPRGQSSEINKDYSVPIYIGLPEKRYKVVGRITDDRDSGFDAVGRAFDEGLGSEKHRMRNCANQAKQHGAEAVLVTDDESVIKVFNLTRKEVKESAPLFKYKHSVVLAIKF
jgi:hypothetical protein